jgi:hypothetical protein
MACLRGEEEDVVEEDVVELMVQLGRVLGGGRKEVERETVTSIVKKVLSGTDAVGKLFEKRAQNFVRLVMAKEGGDRSGIPDHLRTGLLMKGNDDEDEDEDERGGGGGGGDVLEDWARTEGARVGLDVGLKELVAVSVGIKRAVELAQEVVAELLS